MKSYNVAIVGATGMVGRKMAQVLEERRFPVKNIHFFASGRSAGKEMVFAGSTHHVQAVTPHCFNGIEIALFSPGATASREIAPYAIKSGTLVIDNSSAFRMDEGVPLVVPEVNREEIFHHKGIISNPNCSTIQMVVALKPLHDRWKVKRVVVATYQSVSGAGNRGTAQLQQEVAGEVVTDKKFSHSIAFNVLPHIDVFHDDGYTREEHKMVRETQKIMGDNSIKVNATCVRVPVYVGHSESVNVEFEKPFDLAEVRRVLAAAPSVVVQDSPDENSYPLAINAAERDEVFVGRLRRDDTVPSGLTMWIVSDNLRKGAATNAVQIAEEWIKGK